MTAKTEKRALRRAIRDRLVALDPAAFSAGGRAVVAPLCPFLAPPVILFASRATEIATAPLDDALRSAGARRALPLIVGDDLVFKLLPPDVAAASLPLDAFGINSPLPAFESVDVKDCAVVLPGLAFDETGGRLGFGRGFYDRALRTADLDRCVGLCLDEQLVPAVPMASHDIRLRWVCTPARGVFRTSVPSAS